MPPDMSPVVFLGNTLILNEQAARQLGYEFPASVRGRAAQIIP
jgi:ABC-type uncharacterized transport system substrate-binding protein